MRTHRALHLLRYFCADAWDEFRHSRAVNLIALCTLTSTLFLAGLALLGLANVGRHVRGLRDDVRVQVFFLDGVAEADRQQLADELAGAAGVARVESVAPQEALRRYRAWAPELAELTRELATNPLPASLDVMLAAGSGAELAAEAVVRQAAAHATVEGVSWDRAWIQKLESSVRLARLVGMALTLVVFAAVAFIMASVLRLAVHARRDEIEIMQLVGATPAFIRGPFLAAGLAQGLCAALAALGLVEGARRVVLLQGSRGGSLLELVAGAPLPASHAMLLIGVGLAVGLVGSFFAVRLKGSGLTFQH